MIIQIVTNCGTAVSSSMMTYKAALLQYNPCGTVGSSSMMTNCGTAVHDYMHVDI